MFQVRTESPVDENWEQRNLDLIQKAGKRSDLWGTTNKMVEHIWLVWDFDEALQLKGCLELVDGVEVFVQEHST